MSLGDLEGRSRIRGSRVSIIAEVGESLQANKACSLEKSSGLLGPRFSKIVLRSSSSGAVVAGDQASRLDNACLYLP